MEEIVDIYSDATYREHSSKRVLRIALPIALVLLMMAAIFGIALFSYTNNRRDALALSEDLLRSLDRRIATEVRAFLSPASELVQLAHRLVGEAFLQPNWRNRVEPLALQLIQSLPQVTIFSFADPKGDFLMVKKMPDRSVHTKIIEHHSDGRKVTWIRRDPQGREVGREHPDDDTYDPRTRPWYVGASQSTKVYWTDVYIFFTDKIPGITASMAIRSPQADVLGVIGLDIELASLSTFLATLKVGRSGRAMIIEDTGRLVAYPNMGGMFNTVEQELRPLTVVELDDPVLKRAFNRFRIEGHGRRELIVGREKYINIVSSLQSSVGRDWSIMILAPAKDFVGFVSRNNRQTLLMSSGVLFLASVLAGLLIWQGLRADRNARLVLARRKAMEAQSKAFSELAATKAVFDPTDTDALEHLARIAAETMAVRRASVWKAEAGGRQLVCSDSYDRESNGHTRGTILLREDLPQLFEALLDGETLAAADAASDPRTSELHRLYLDPLGCNGLVSLPILEADRFRGALWFEEEDRTRQWSTEDMAFARAMAGLLSLRLSRVSTQAECVTGEKSQEEIQAIPPSAHTPPDSAVERRAQRLARQIGKYDRTPPAGGADIYPDVTVLVLQFADAVMLAQRTDADEPLTVADRLLEHLGGSSSTRKVAYMKLVGDQLVCAAGFGNDVDEGAGAIAELALEIRTQCLTGFSDRGGKRLEIRIGIDTAAVIGSVVGGEHKMYNLWGDAVRMAAMMAESGSGGEIQLSESTYRRLQGRYLLKMRGHYYLPHVGELSTYLLTGRL